jgi:hypothetical protein
MQIEQTSASSSSTSANTAPRTAAQHTANISSILAPLIDSDKRPLRPDGFNEQLRQLRTYEAENRGSIVTQALSEALHQQKDPIVRAALIHTLANHNDGLEALKIFAATHAHDALVTTLIGSAVGCKATAEIGNRLHEKLSAVITRCASTKTGDTAIDAQISSTMALLRFDHEVRRERGTPNDLRVTYLQALLTRIDAKLTTLQSGDFSPLLTQPQIEKLTDAATKITSVSARMCILETLGKQAEALGIPAYALFSEVNEEYFTARGAIPFEIDRDCPIPDAIFSDADSHEGEPVFPYFRLGTDETPSVPLIDTVSSALDLFVNSANAKDRSALAKESTERPDADKIKELLADATALSEAVPRDKKCTLAEAQDLLARADHICTMLSNAWRDRQEARRAIVRWKAQHVAEILSSYKASAETVESGAVSILRAWKLMGETSNFEARWNLMGSEQRMHFCRCFADRILEQYNLNDPAIFMAVSRRDKLHGNYRPQSHVEGLLGNASLTQQFVSSTPAEEVIATVAHETYHAVQYALTMGRLKFVPGISATDLEWWRLSTRFNYSEDLVPEDIQDRLYRNNPLERSTYAVEARFIEKLTELFEHKRE